MKLDNYRKKLCIFPGKLIHLLTVSIMFLLINHFFYLKESVLIPTLSNYINSLNRNQMIINNNTNTARTKHIIL